MPLTLAKLRCAFAACCLALPLGYGCAGKHLPLAPVDDRLGSVNDLLKSRYDLEDGASKSATDTVAGIRQAREQLRR